METLRSLIDGHPYEGVGRYVLHGPGSGAPFAEVHEAGPEQVDAAVAAARDAFEPLGRVLLSERLEWCEQIAARIDAQAETLAAQLSEEHGKPMHEARREVASGARGFRVAAREVWRLDGYVPQTLDPHKRVVVVRQRRGVWAVITPWNFPFNIPIEYLATAVATGTPVVWKPAPSTPRIAVRLVELMQEQLPSGAVNLVLTADVTCAQRLITHPGIDCVGLTGGAETGEIVAQQAWDKHLLLELGGANPIIVLDDADQTRAVELVTRSAFVNAGQVCSAAGRLLVSEKIADTLVPELRRAVGTILVGPPDDDRTVMGPVHTESVAAGLDSFVERAVDDGGTVVSGGGRMADRPTALYYQPTVLDEVSAETAADEVFGPVLPVVRLGSDEDVLRVANATELGLVAAVFTRSIDRAFSLAEGLEVGTVVVNDHSNYWELHLPFGGWQGTRSGRGRIGGRHTIEEFTQLKTISIDVAGASG